MSFEWLLTRPTVVSLAILAAAIVMGASALRAAGRLSEARARQLNIAGYALMGASMLLFIVAGLRGSPP